MMETKKGKKCRNLVEQVQKNMEDIEVLKTKTPTTDFVINASVDEIDPRLLHITQRVGDQILSFDFRGGKPPIAGVNVNVQETDEGYIISATTEPVGSVSFENVAGSPFDNTLLGNELNNRFILNFSGQGGNETNGWFRTTHQSGVQVKSLLDNNSMWLLSNRIRYYPTSSSSPYHDLYFPEKTGTLALEFTTTRDLELNNNNVLGLSLQFTDRITELEDDYEYLYQNKQDHDSLEKDVAALGFLKGSDRFINSLRVENHNLRWSYDDGVTGSTYIPYKTSDLQNDSNFITLQDIPTIPTKTSDLINDSNFSEIVINPQDEATGTATKIKVNGVTYSIQGGGGGGAVDNVLQNGVSVVVDGIAYIVTPTKVSDLDNDSGFITAQDIPAPTWESLVDKPFTYVGKGLSVDESGNLSTDVKQEDIPTLTSQLENDSGFIDSTDLEKYHDDTKQDKIDVIVESNTNLTYLGQTYVVPQLTADNVTTLFNALANGNSATVTDATGNTHYQVKQVDTDGDNFFIIIDYYGQFSVEYELDENDQVTITGKGGGSGVHLYRHSIFVSQREDAEGVNYQTVQISFDAYTNNNRVIATYAMLLSFLRDNGRKFAITGTFKFNIAETPIKECIATEIHYETSPAESILVKGIFVDESRQSIGDYGKTLVGDRFTISDIVTQIF